MMLAERDKDLNPACIATVHPNSPPVVLLRPLLPDPPFVGLGLLGQRIGRYDHITLSLRSLLSASQKTPAQSDLTPAWMQASHASCMAQGPCLLQARMR